MKLFILQASIGNNNCNETTITATGSATTFYGIPESVINARVVNNTNTSSDCILEWEHVEGHLDVISYKVNV